MEEEEEREKGRKKSQSCHHIWQKPCNLTLCKDRHIIKKFTKRWQLVCNGKWLINKWKRSKRRHGGQSNV